MGLGIRTTGLNGSTELYDTESGDVLELGCYRAEVAIDVNEVVTAVLYCYPSEAQVKTVEAYAHIVPREEDAEGKS
jgi:hypothetical protein